MHSHTRLICAAIMGVSLIPSARAQEAKSPALQILNRYVGSWDETVTSKPAVWTPERTTATTTTTRQWILNGTVIENKGAWTPGNIEFLHLMTYDPQREEYRQWYYAKDTPVPQVYRGKWNEETQTFTFTGILADGVRSTSQQRFVDKDTFTWTLVAKDDAGQVVLDMEGKCVRKKK